MKHKKALLKELKAAKALFHKKASTKVTLHYDTTKRSRVKGECPCLILNFKDDDPSQSKMLSLRPIFFAHEDREQIEDLMVETLKRLAVAVDEPGCTASKLWENIYAFMTKFFSHPNTSFLQKSHL